MDVENIQNSVSGASARSHAGGVPREILTLAHTDLARSELMRNHHADGA